MIFMQKVAVFTLIDGKGRMLLQHRNESMARFPNLWGLFGGLVEDGEIPEVAVRREAKEEIGVDLEEMEFCGKYLSEGYELHLFIGQLEAPVEQLKNQQTEGDDLGMFSLDEIESLKMTPRIKEILQKIFKPNNLKCEY